VVFWCSLNEYSSATCNMLASCKCLSDFADFSVKIWLAPLPCISCAVQTSNPELIHCFKNYSCLQSPTVVLNFATKKTAFRIQKSGIYGYYYCRGNLITTSMTLTIEFKEEQLS
jgi:hypothetical protein